LRSRDLTFAPDGLQPAGLLPFLTGIIGEASGTVGARLNARFGPAGVETGGTVTLSDLSFQGPGVAVARTGGLTGTVTLDSLAPIRTVGTQGLEVGLLDLRAIQLTGGEARFALPGDDTLLIERARFPWLGGEVGIFDSEVGFGGGGRVTLRGEGLEIEEALAILDVPGLSGQGRLEAVLPLALDAFSVSIEDGRFRSTTQGVLRYQGEASAAVAGGNPQTELAFSALEELRFDELSGTVSGPLAGTLLFGFTLEGRSGLRLPDKRIKERVVSPVIYRINVEAPLLQLIEGATASAREVEKVTDAVIRAQVSETEGQSGTERQRERAPD
jgi:hypothetical protein